MSVLIIDADPIIYGAGFAAQTSTYTYVLEGPDGELVQETWTDGNEALRFIRAGKYKVLDKQVHVDAQDPSFARQCARTTISSIIERCAERLDTNDPQIEMYLSGPDNFRYKLATIAPYKGDRPPPPVHYQTVRDYLTERWGAVVVSGMEADDKVSIRGRELNEDGTPWILATIDKDLDQVPGLHYGYQKHVFYNVDEWDAEWTFWRQTLSGDSTDNIPGCYKIGETKAVSILNKSLDLFTGDPTTQRDAWNEWVWGTILQTYRRNMDDYPDRYPKGMLAPDAALETARLVFMQHYEGQLWNPPGVPHGEVSELAAIRPAG